MKQRYIVAGKAECQYEGETYAEGEVIELPPEVAASFGFPEASEDASEESEAPTPAPAPAPSKGEDTYASRTRSRRSRKEQRGSSPTSTKETPETEESSDDSTSSDDE